MKSTPLTPNIQTDEPITWCPGCPNFMILASVKQTIEKLIKDGEFKHADFVMTTDIGCNSKIFDYLNLSGIYCLHGRALPTGIGIALGNPNKKILTFAGDGGTYAEGMEHFIHAFRYNANQVLILHDNQSFSLTTGQPTPTSQIGHKSKAKPQGEENMPFNPLMLALSAGATFVARVNARDIKHTSEILEKAIQHKGFAFVEVIQDCLIFNTEMNNKDARMYKIHNTTNFEEALKFAQEYNYNTKTGKIPVGIFYRVLDKTLSEKWTQLKKLQNSKKCWADKL